MLILFASFAQAASCVWRVTGPNGPTLYLGGSVHLLRSSDYPLPPQFNVAFDASSRLAFEVNPQQMLTFAKEFGKAGEYPKGDSLKNHVDVRTYAYLRRIFALLHVPEEKFSRYHAWMIAVVLEQVGHSPTEYELGVERFIQRRALAHHKPMVGLESPREHAAVFSGLSDVQAEAYLLLHFIPNAANKTTRDEVLAAWRRGDADFLARATAAAYRDFPALAEREVDARNRAWLPKIEGYLAGGQTYFVVAGAGHMGGPNGLLALLRGRGYRIEQL